MRFLTTDQQHITLEGQIEFANANQVYRQGQTYLQHGAEIFDLAKISYSDSSGLAVLLAWQRLAKRLAKPIRFVNLPPQMQAIAQVCDINKLLVT